MFPGALHCYLSVQATASLLSYLITALISLLPVNHVLSAKSLTRYVAQQLLCATTKHATICRLQTAVYSTSLYL